MKGFLFFTGTFLRNLVNYPREYGILMLYYLVLVLFAYLIDFQSSGGFGLLFVILFLAPIFRSIYQGLPLDCLNHRSAIERERSG